MVYDKSQIAFGGNWPLSDDSSKERNHVKTQAKQSPIPISLTFLPAIFTKGKQARIVGIL
jgi:hypothetical protein